MTNFLLVEQREGIATVTLNHPDRLNAINIRMYERLPGTMREMDESREVKVIVLRGAGGDSFAVGADITEFERERGSASSARSYNDKVAAAERSVAGVSKPTIAMVHGYCIGGGAGLALSCDVRFADLNAQFAITPAKLGLVYSLESTKRLVDAVGPSRAKWILFSGWKIPAARAAELGIFDEVTETDDLEDFTYGFAEAVATRAQFSVQMAKEMIRRIVDGQRTDDEETAEIRNSSFDTSDYAEGVRAFLEKRAPKFGR